MGYKYGKKTVILTAVTMLLLAAVICDSKATSDEMKNEDSKTKAANAGNEAVEAGKDMKESTELWTGWVKDTVSEGLGLRTEEAKDAGLDCAKNAKDKITGTGEYESAKDMSYEKAQKAKEGVEYAKDETYDKAKMAKYATGYVKDATMGSVSDKAKMAKDAAGYVKDSTYENADMIKDAAGSVKDATFEKAHMAKDAAYEKAKQGAGSVKDSAGSVKDSAYEKAQNARLRRRKREVKGRWNGVKMRLRKGFEATNAKAGEGLEAAKEAMGKKYDEAAEPRRQKAKDFKENVF
ncbi:hypothetical protein Tco_1096219 [Tanacetum coccineum]